MGDYPVLHLIVRYGAAGAVVASALAFALVAWLGFYALGWVALILAIVAAAVVYVIGKSYAELVRLITEMLLPR